MKKFRLMIVTPTGKKFDDEVEQISLMGECGSLSVLADHIPFVTNIKAGKFRIYSENEVTHWQTADGLLSVTDENVRIITSSFFENESGED